MATIRKIYQYPLPSWVENIAATSTGHLLVSHLSPPELHFIDPSTNPPTSTLAHSFVGDGSNITGLLGIGELERGLFAFVAGVVPQTPVPGEYSIWSIDLRHGIEHKKVEKIADVPGGELLNGMAKVNERVLFIADSMKGVIWSFDLHTRKSSIVIDHPSLQSGRDGNGNFIKAGVNGLRVHNDFVYFSNSATGALSRVKIDCHSAKIIGEVEVVADGMEDADDFAIAKDGTIYLTRNKALLVKVRPNGEKTDVQDVSVENLRGPTSAVFGRTREDDNVLYVTTNGRVTGAPAEGGSVVAVRV